MGSDHRLKSGDRIVVTKGFENGVVSVEILSEPTEAYPRGHHAIAQIKQEELKILITDLQAHVL